MQVFIEMAQAAIPVWRDVLLYCLISCSAAIFLTGSLKVAFLGRVSNKKVRKLLCFLTGCVLTAGSAAAYKFCEGSQFTYFLPSLAFLIPAEIVLYTLYENTLLRDAIDAIAKKFLGCVVPLLVQIARRKTTKEASKVQLISAVEASKVAAAKQVNQILDKDLKNL